MNGDLTIAGETAPIGGIHVRGSRFEVKASNVVLRHFGVRPGDGPGSNPTARDGVVVMGPVENVTLDHMSLTHALDENFSTYGVVKNLTVTNSLIAEGLYRSIHPENETRNGVYIGHSMGALLDANNTSVWSRNVFANNNDRNLRGKAGNQIEFVNNYVFNWGRFSGGNMFNVDPGANKFHFVGNVYKRGGASQNDHPCIHGEANTAVKVSGFDNICPAGRFTDYVVDTGQVLIPTITEIVPAAELLQRLLPVVGARPWDRFPLDQRILDEVASGMGTIKDCITVCGVNPDGTIDIPVGAWPVIGGGVSTPTAIASPSSTVVAVVTVTPTVSATVALCTVEVPCSSLTLKPLPSPTVTVIATATRTPKPTATATATSTAGPTLPPGSCEQKVTRCREISEECRRYFAGKVSAKPFNPAAPCETHRSTCWELDSECPKWIK
jgi:hypothetical protein